MYKLNILKFFQSLYTTLMGIRASGIGSFIHRNRVLISQIGMSSFCLRQAGFKEICCEGTAWPFYATWMCLCLRRRMSLFYLKNPEKERELSRQERSLDRDNTTRLPASYTPSACRCCIHCKDTVSICRRCCVSATMTTGRPGNLPGIPLCLSENSPADIFQKAARIWGILKLAHLANSLFMIDFAGILMC